MKRALVLLLVVSMLSTCTVHAADVSEVIYDESEYAEEYSQSGSEDDFCQEEYSDNGSEDSTESGDLNSEAETADTEDDSYYDSESVDYSGESAEENSGDEETPSSGNEETPSLTEAGSDDEREEMTENPETVPDSADSGNEESVAAVPKESDTEVSAEDSRVYRTGYRLPRVDSGRIGDIPFCGRSWFGVYCLPGRVLRL